MSTTSQPTPPTRALVRTRPQRTVSCWCHNRQTTHWILWYVINSEFLPPPLSPHLVLSFRLRASPEAPKRTTDALTELAHLEEKHDPRHHIPRLNGRHSPRPRQLLRPLSAGRKLPQDGHSDHLLPCCLQCRPGRRSPLLDSPCSAIRPLRRHFLGYPVDAALQCLGCQVHRGE
jgi:hypothetical protein